MSVSKEIGGRYLERPLAVREDGQEKWEGYAATEFLRMLLPSVTYSYFDKTVES
jgi:hypothetical protein